MGVTHAKPSSSAPILGADWDAEHVVSGLGGAALEPSTLDSTYGDHFLSSALDPKWTRRGRPANEDLFSSPGILIPSPVNGANFGDTQEFTDADEFDIFLAASHYSLADEGFGIICVNSSGTGLWTGYRNTNRLGIFTVTTWATSLEPVSNLGLAGSTLYGTGEKRWWKLMKRKTALAGDLYAAAFSLDGMRWTHGTGWYDPSDFTPAYIGWWLGVQNASANRPLAIDLFDAKRCSLGSNLLRFPTSGTVTPSSDASSQGGTIGNVINGSAGDEWYFANSNAAGVSLTLTFSVAQTLNRLRFRGRTDQFGDALIEFSDGSQYPVGLYTGSSSWVVWDVPATKTTTYIKIIWQKSQNGSNPGFSEIEAYLATAL